MPPKKKDAKGKGKKGDKTIDDAAIAAVKAFYKGYCAASAANEFEPLPLPFSPITVEGTGPFGRVVIHPQVCAAITLGHVRVLLESLVQSHYQYLLTLALWNLPLKDAGASTVASFLINNRTVINCEVTDCGISAQGCKVLGEALERNRTLTRLSLDHNAFSNSGLEALSTTLPLNQGLRVLSMKYCQLTEAAAPCITQSVLRMGTLVSLELRGNLLGPVAITNIVQVIATGNIPLEHIGIADTSFGLEPEVHAALAACMERNQTCISYDLRGNPIGDGNAYMYAKLIKGESKHIISLELTEMIDPPLFKQIMTTAAANKKEWVKKNKKKGGKKGKKGKGKKK